MSIFDARRNAWMDALVMEIASARANRIRNRRGDAMEQPGKPKIVAEGDSWFCYPIEWGIEGPRDAILHLGEEFSIYTQAKPGDVLWSMVDTFDLPSGLSGAIRAKRPDIVILSGGGNDLLGEGRLEAMLARGPATLTDYFRTRAYRETFDRAVNHLEWLVTRILDTGPAVKVVVHGYDYAVVRQDRRGPWLNEPMARLGIPVWQRQEVVNFIVDRFNTAVERIADRANRRDASGGQRVFYASLKGATANFEWFDELHPSTPGFAGVAARFRREILRAYPLVA